MANEISLTAKISATKSSVTVTNSTSTKTQTMAAAAAHMHHTIQAVGTSREAVALGDVDNSNATGDEYWVLLFNRDATNFVIVEALVGSATYYQVGLMRPGECWGPVRMQKLDGDGYGALYMDADTAACNVEVVAVEAGDPAA